MQIGYQLSLINFNAPKANEYSIDHYDHHIKRANGDIFLDSDNFANPKLLENFFIKTPYVFTTKKYDHVISAALRGIQAIHFNNFSLTFHFLIPKERDLNCSHDVMLRTKQTPTYTYFKFIQHHYTQNTPSRQFHHRFQNINSKSTSPFSLTSLIVLKILTFKAFSEIKIPSPRCIILPLNQNFQRRRIPPTHCPTPIPKARRSPDPRIHP